MKVIIISDIKGKSESIIPYGLNIAKYLQSEVDIIHSIDPRTQQGVQSSQSDSKSITPGTKLSHEEIIEREKNSAAQLLDKLMSREASRLNYPLKTNTIIEENTVEKSINKRIEKGSNHLVLINSEPDNSIFHSRDEILETFQNTDSLIFLIPPGTEFKEVKEVMLIADFSESNGMEKLVDSAALLNHFNPLINAVDVAKSKKFAEKELQSDAWLQTVGKTVFSSTVKANILSGDDYFETIDQYIERVNPDVILPFKKDTGILNANSQKKLLKYLIDNSKLPILYS